MAKEKEKLDYLFELFAGEYVVVILRFIIERTTQTSKEVELLKTPMHVSGYFTDQDDNFIYLGHKPNKYHQAVSKSDIVHLELSSEEDQTVESVSKALKDFKEPEDDKGYN
jgi:hypothetical protein